MLDTMAEYTNRSDLAEVGNEISLQFPIIDGFHLLVSPAIGGNLPVEHLIQSDTSADVLDS